MRILVVGKNGQVGSCLVEQLNQHQEIDFLALDRNELNITDKEQVNKIISNYKPNFIINAAAYTAVDKAEKDIEQVRLVNYFGTRNLAIAANQVNACLLHISTDYVFSGDKFGFYNESDDVDPQSIYGKSKAEGEVAILECCPAHIILRTAWVFSEYGNNFVKTMLRLAKERKRLNVVDDQFGGPTYAGDIANAMIKISYAIFNGCREYGVYHFSGYPYVSWKEFAEQILKSAEEQNILNTPVIVDSIETKDYPTPAKRPANSRLNCDRIEQCFSIKQSDWISALKNLRDYK